MLNIIFKMFKNEIRFIIYTLNVKHPNPHQNRRKIHYNIKFKLCTNK